MFHSNISSNDLIFQHYEKLDNLKLCLLIFSWLHKHRVALFVRYNYYRLTLATSVALVPSVGLFRAGFNLTMS